MIVQGVLLGSLDGVYKLSDWQKPLKEDNQPKSDSYDCASEVVEKRSRPVDRLGQCFANSLRN